MRKTTLQNPRGTAKEMNYLKSITLDDWAFVAFLVIMAVCFFVA